MTQPKEARVDAGMISLRGMVTWSLRGHWKLWYPWVLVITQAGVIVALLLTLQQESLRPVISPCDASPTMPPTEELRRVILSQSQDSRILQELPVPATVKRRAQQQRVFFNRVPKCGTHTLLDIIIQLSAVHNYTFARSSRYMTFHIDDAWKEVLVNRFMTAPAPLLYERHLHFLRFDKYGGEQPVFFNIIRDPIQRMASWYYFRRFEPGHERGLPTAQRIRSFDECVLGNYSECMAPLGDDAEEGYFNIIPFFCGQEAVCRTDSELALVRAVHNVKTQYAVVGVSELYTEFIEVLEHVLPSFFRGASYVYQLQDAAYGRKHVTTYKLPVSDDAARALYPKLKLEYKFYNFVKARFRRLYAALKQAQDKYPTT